MKTELWLLMLETIVALRHGKEEISVGHPELRRQLDAVEVNIMRRFYLMAKELE